MSLRAGDARERNLEDAIIGAQMLINNPEAALEVLLGNDMYPHLQAMQPQTRESSFTASHPEHPDVVARARPVDMDTGTDVVARARPVDMDTSVANSTSSSHSERSTLRKTPLEAALQAVLAGGGGTRPQQGTQRQDTDTTSLLSQLSGHLEANASSSHSELPTSLRTSLEAAVQSLARSRPQGTQQGVDATRGESFAESQRLLSDLQGRVEAGGGGMQHADTLMEAAAATNAASISPHSELPASLRTSLDVAFQAIFRSGGRPVQEGMQQQGVDEARTDSHRLLSELSGNSEADAGARSPTANPDAASFGGAGASLPGQQQPVPAGADGTRRPVVLYTQADDTTLSRYQCVIRQQIEMFEATDDDVQFNISRMSKIIVLGQVGIRCRHCVVLPEHSRPKAAVYYPRTLDSVYQFGQNMVKNHLLACCELIPSETKNLMMALQESRKRGRGGRDRWARAAQEIGVIEDENGLRFA
jgi:hypothetical protein